MNQSENNLGNAYIAQCYLNTNKIDNTISIKDFTREIPFIRIVIFNVLIIVFACLGIVLKKIYKKKKSRL